MLVLSTSGRGIELIKKISLILKDFNFYLIEITVTTN